MNVIGRRSKRQDVNRAALCIITENPGETLPQGNIDTQIALPALHLSLQIRPPGHITLVRHSATNSQNTVGTNDRRVQKNMLFRLPERRLQTQMRLPPLGIMHALALRKRLQMRKLARFVIADRSNGTLRMSAPPVQDGLSYADRESLKQEVSDLLESARTKDWDGEGAFPLSPETATTAQRLIDTFPAYVEIPDVAATPHGEVDFDWVVDKDLMLTISVVATGQIAFAARLGDARPNGREAWTDVLPPCIQSCLDQLHRRQGRRGNHTKA